MHPKHSVSSPTSANPWGAIYTRQSSAPQEKNYSKDVQEAACREYAAEHGYDVVGVWHDTLVGTTIDRPGLDSLKAAAKRGEVGHIIFYKQDRLARGDAFTVQEFLCKQAGLKLHCPLEPLLDGFLGTVDRFGRGIKSGLESTDIRIRTQAGRERRAKDGLLLPGNRPLYGYEWRDVEAPNGARRAKGGYRIDPATGPAVQRIFRELGRGTATRHIADALTADAIPPPNGAKLWRTATVRDLAKNPRYMGTGAGYRRRHEIDPDTGRRVRLAEEQAGVPLVAGTVPPLVSREEWERAQECLAANKGGAIRNNRNPESYLLRAGHIFCGQCGQTVQTYVKHLKGGDVPRYRVLRDRERHVNCANVTYDAAELDAAAWTAVQRILAEPDALFSRLEAGEGDDPDAGELAGIGREIARAARKGDGLIDSIALATNDASRAALMAGLDRATAERSALESRRDTLAARRAEFERRRADRAELRAWIDRTRAKLAGVPWPTMRADGRTLEVAFTGLGEEQTARLTAILEEWGDNPPLPPPGWEPDPDLGTLVTAQLRDARARQEREPSYQEKREALRALGLKVTLLPRGSTPPYRITTAHQMGAAVESVGNASSSGSAGSPRR